MDDQHDFPTPSAEPDPASGTGFGRILLTIFTSVILPLVLLGGGVAVAARLLQTKPRADRKEAPRRARLVDVEVIALTSRRVEVTAMGTVRAARTVELRPRVGGEIVHMEGELFPGGRFDAGDLLLRIDATDYDLAVKQRESDVARAEADLAMERGQQTIARREFELLGEGLEVEDSDLVLRRPQLATVEARLAAARAALTRARLDLERTEVKVPFNAQVRTRDVDLGAHVSSASRLATLVGTDEYWVEVAVPVDRLRWIDVPRVAGATGASVRLEDEVAWGPGVSRTGTVLRLIGDIEEQGRMARLLVSVPDPLSLEKGNAVAPILLLGGYVRATIDGREIDEVAVVRRDHVHDGDAVWVMGAEDRLEIRRVDIAYRGPDVVLVSGGLAAGDRLVVSEIPAPHAGMPLRVASEEAEDSGHAAKADPR